MIAGIAADLRTLIAHVSDAETTAPPAVALALQEVRRHLLRASVELEDVKLGEEHKDECDMMGIWVCEICNAVHKLADVDPAWETEGCPKCHE
jgi:hypothetical protein